MTKNLDKEGLRKIVDDYDLFYVDLWGVVHNGIKLHKNAIFTIKEILKLKKNIVLLTNAPRPNKTVRDFLEKMGMEKKLEIMYIHLEKQLLIILKNFIQLKNSIILVHLGILIYLVTLKKINQKILIIVNICCVQAFLMITIMI